MWRCHLSGINSNPMNTCKKIGITGGIGSGKTTVCHIFENLGIPVYYADEWSKWLIEHKKSLKSAIIDVFGPEAYDENGKYQRAYIASIVFKDPEKLKKLNELVHPVVADHSQQWHDEMAATKVPYTLKEAALLIESGSYTQLDSLILVTAPEETRIHRVMKRDGMAREQVKARMRAQMPEAEKLKYASYTIDNSGHVSLVKQVWELHQKLRQG
jgi:dephospho-CoA kinase